MASSPSAPAFLTWEMLLCESVKYFPIETVSSLLRDHPGINVNWADRFDQRTPLHIASRKGYVEVVKLLLAHHAIDVNMKNIQGQTPFELACANGHVGVVKVLLKDPRVDISQDDDHGRTPLW